MGSSARSAGIGMPDCAISASRPMVFSATVFPPVLGPLMTSWRCWLSSSTVIGTTATPRGFQRAFQQRMARVAQDQRITRGLCPMTH